jgi:penicillin-binding protein 2
MKKLIPTSRLIGGAVAVLLLLILYFGVLFKLQIIEGAKYSEESANSIVTTETVAAVRGNVLDRYGRPLISSRECHNIVINTEELFDQEDYNADILRLIETVEEYGQKYKQKEHIELQRVGI